MSVRAGGKDPGPTRREKRAQEERLLEVWAAPKGLGLLVGGQQYRGRPLVHGRDLRLLPRRRRAGRC